MTEPKIIDIGKPAGPEEEPKKSFNFRPLTSYGLPRWSVFVLAALGVLYILSPTLGIIEFIPDNLPIIGNLDEGVAFTLIMYGVLELMEGKRNIG